MENQWVWEYLYCWKVPWQPLLYVEPKLKGDCPSLKMPISHRNDLIIFEESKSYWLRSRDFKMISPPEPGWLPLDDEVHWHHQHSQDDEGLAELRFLSSIPFRINLVVEWKKCGDGNGLLHSSAGQEKFQFQCKMKKLPHFFSAQTGRRSLAV